MMPPWTVPYFFVPSVAWWFWLSRSALQLTPFSIFTLFSHQNLIPCIRRSLVPCSRWLRPTIPVWPSIELINWHFSTFIIIIIIIIITDVSRSHLMRSLHPFLSSLSFITITSGTVPRFKIHLQRNLKVQNCHFVQFSSSSSQQTFRMIGFVLECYSDHCPSTSSSLLTSS